MSLVEWVAVVLMITGCSLGAIGALGLVRFPDVFGRMHSATKPPTLGLVLVVLGAALSVRDASDLGLLLVVVMLQFLTAPVAAHLVGRAAYDSGGLLDEDTVMDDLAERERADAARPDADRREPDGPDQGS